MVTIAQLRERKNWTQTDLADRLDVSRVTVARWETGQRVPDRFAVRALSQVFGVKAADIELPERKPRPGAAPEDR